METRIHSRLLKRQQTPGEYDIYKAALEWDLTDPIVIEKAEDFKSEPRWRETLKPYHHQVTNLITFCRRLPVTLLADDVGLGKTISAGLVISELIARSRLSKILVVCPKLLGPQWKEELETKFDVPAEVVVGRDLLKANPTETGAVITTYASARLHLGSIPEDRFQMLVLDEAHKLRNLYGTDKAPQVAKTFHKALEQRRFRFVLMLTATPIHNRLWDLYSLVDLLTVARGHQNPFGTEGAFARKFIADNKEQARHLKPEARDEFRSIVYGYMSRVRRGDARLYFPDREVQLHKVHPTQAELDLVKAIAKPIQALNSLAQISILQALASSPDALLAQLTNMARNGTVPGSLAETVRDTVTSMPLSAKLQGLQSLITELKKKEPSEWRLVVFTTRLETQTTIQSFLLGQGLKVGIINGQSGTRNQETLTRFRKTPPDCHVIVSTEAGSEGVNLQVANILVNYDLPWNPMIVEQRIGRVQRLGSKFAKVGIFNIILQGTFEEYIVGRLMEKLQMASHAIGDIDALLEASGINEDDENGVTSFEERIRQLVVASLAGKDVQLETRQAEASIENAKIELEREEATINDLLGDATGKEYAGPRVPKLPPVHRSMTPRELTLRGLPILNVNVAETDRGVVARANGGEEFIHFDGEAPLHPKSTLYAQGTPSFSRLVSQIVATGVHSVVDLDIDTAERSKDLAGEWANRIGSLLKEVEVRDVRRRFGGVAMIRIRATVAHDAYERLIDVKCSPDANASEANRSFMAPLVGAIDDPRAVGVAPRDLVSSAEADQAIGEFLRFYLERRELEKQAAGSDERKRKKLDDDFTPQLEMSVVGLNGELHRDVTVQARYRIDGADYSSVLTLRPHTRTIVDEPELGRCGKTGREVPLTCLKECQISGTRVLQHLLAESEKSQRQALPQYITTCEMTGKRLLHDETERSGVTGKLVDKTLLKTSAFSGTRAEPEHFGKCEFSGDGVLTTELALSEISGKSYRRDQKSQSVVSGKAGHKDEFITCSQTGQTLTSSEAERCEVTFKCVLPGTLETCAVTGKRVLPTELERCAVTGKRALRSLFVASSISGMRILEEIATRSASGLFCSSAECGLCVWSGRYLHPTDLCTCVLTTLTIAYPFARPVTNGPALLPLVDLLGGKHSDDKKALWPAISKKTSELIGKGSCHVEAAILAPNGNVLAACIEVRTMLGLRRRKAGILYSLDESSLIGRIADPPAT